MMFMLKILFLIFFLSIVMMNKSRSQSEWIWSQPKPTGNMLYSVYFTDRNTGYASGALGTIMKTTDGGMSWQILNTEIKDDLFRIFFIDPLKGFAIGKAG